MVAAGRNTAILLAGGVGTRVGGPLPKQLIKVAGRPIMEHTLAALDAHPDVDDIVVMMVAGHHDEVAAMVERGGFGKVRRVLESGDSRSATTLRALDSLPADGTGDGDPKVMTHDAVRPFLSPRIIADCFAALDTHDAVDVAIPSRDTVVDVDPDGTVTRALPRATVRRGQTPQAFRLSVLRRAYARAVQDPDFEPADDCSVVHRYLPDVAIAVVPGDERNIKVTEPVDVHIADKLFQLASRQDRPPELDDDAHARLLADRSVLVLGGTHGLGAAVADLAERRGARVRRLGRSTGTRVDRPEDVAAAVEATAAELGGLDLVVDAVATAARGHVLDASEETVHHATEVNYLAPVRLARACLPHLRRSRGSLLLMTSPAYAGGHHGVGLQSMADAAVVNLTQALADEWSPDGVRISCLIRPDRDTDRDADRDEVARRCLDTLLWERSGQVVDPRPIDGLGWD